MKTTLLLLITLIGFTKTASADTTDYWHVYYNEVKVKEFQLSNGNEVLIEAKIIKATDSLRVIFFRDTPCRNCKSLISILSDLDDTIKWKVEGHLEGDGVSIPINDLLLLNRQEGQKSFKVIWTNGPDGMEMLLFTVRII